MNNVLERLLKWPWPNLGCSAGVGEAGSFDNLCETMAGLLCPSLRFGVGLEH